MQACVALTQDTEEMVVAHCARWVARWESGDFAGARADIAAAAPMATRLRQPAQLWLVAISQGAVALFEGRFADVEAHAAPAGSRAAVHSNSTPTRLVSRSLVSSLRNRAGSPTLSKSWSAALRHTRGIRTFRHCSRACSPSMVNSNVPGESSSRARRATTQSSRPAATTACSRWPCSRMSSVS